MKTRQKAKTPSHNVWTGSQVATLPDFQVNAWVILHATHWPVSPDHPTHHTMWMLDFYLERGAIKLNSPTGPWLKREPHVLHLYPPFTMYCEKSLAKHKVSPPPRIWLGFTGGEKTALLQHIGNPLGIARYRDPHRLITTQMIAMAETATGKGDHAFWAMQPAFAGILKLLLAAHSLGDGWYEIQKDVASPAQTDSLVMKIADYLRGHITSHLTTADIAKAVGLSPSTVAHRYRAATGEAPMQALRRLRIFRAKTLLAQGMELQGVADATGFFDAFHLSREFKKIVGLTPSAFRQQSAASIEEGKKTD